MNANEKEAILKQVRELKADYRFEIVKEIEDSRLNWTASIEMDKEGLIYMPLTLRNEIACYDNNLQFIRSFGISGKKSGELDKPYQIVLLNDLLYVLEAGNKRIQIFSRDGGTLKITSMENYPDVSISMDSKIFKWGNMIGIFNVKTRYIGLFDTELKFKRTIPCLDQPSEKFLFLKEVNGSLLFPLISGEVYLWDGEKWIRFEKYPLSSQLFEYLSDIIPYKKYWIAVDHIKSSINKFSEEKKIFTWYAREKYLGKGIVDDEFLYLVRSNHQENGTGNLLKIHL